MHTASRFRMLCSAGVTLALLFVTACATSSQAGASPTATVPPTNTPIPTCATLVPSASSAGIFANFPEVKLPTGSVISSPKTTPGGAGQFSITEYDACFTGTIDQIFGGFSAHKSLYAQLLGYAWGAGINVTFPYDQQLQVKCQQSAPNFCAFSDGVAPDQRYVAIENVKDNGGGLITFHMRLALPPSVPNCPPGPPVQFVTTFPNHPGTPLPLPPMSSLGISFGSSALMAYHMCSAGTASSVDSFMTTELPKVGFTQGTLNVGNNLTCGNPNHTFVGWLDPSNKYAVTWTVANTAGSDLNPGRSWILTICQ